MNFASDNVYGMHESMLEALARVNAGAAPSYGADEATARVEKALGEVFERDVSVFPVTTGTAANAISIACLTPPYGAVLCHPESHVMVDECGAPELYSGGAKLVPVEGEDGRIAPDGLRAVLDGLIAGNQHQVQAACLTLTQSTETGTVYSPEAVAELCEIARGRNMRVHMDGARFGNAVAGTGASPADLTWRAGVDMLSFGATKNGAMAAEAIVSFDPSLSDEIMFRRKRGGHLVSKGRFVSAQLEAYLEGGRWLDLAAHANAMATRLGEGVSASQTARLAYPVEANEVFVVMPETLDAKLRAAGAVYHEWPGSGPADEHGANDGEILLRLVTSYATTANDVDGFIGLLA